MNKVPRTQPDGGRGLRCRHCNCGHFRVIYTRAARDGTLLRRRECRNCGKRITTWEWAIGQTGKAGIV